MRNKFEDSVAKQLKRRRKTFNYESERLSYVLHRHYVPDFVVHMGDRKLYIECKGYLRLEDKSKLRAVRSQTDSADIRILFDSERNYLRNFKWCEKNGFPCAWGRIPDSWMKEKK